MDDVHPDPSAPNLRPVGLDDLVVHPAAAQGLSIFREHGLVGWHPLYMVGVQVPPHRGGPAMAALLTLSDGRLISATGRRTRTKKDLNKLFPHDTFAADADELRDFSRKWNVELGGFAALGLDAVTDYEAAERLLEWASLAPYLSAGLAEDLNRRPHSLPWDHSASAAMTFGGVACAVFGFTPDAHAVDRLTVDDDFKRALLLPPLPPGMRLSDWHFEIASSVDPRLIPLLEEANHNIVRSPRSSVMLFRTVAEIVVDCLGVESPQRMSLSDRISRVEAVWAADVHLTGSRAVQARERSWRGRVVACMETVRELGNMLHAPSEVSADDARRSQRFVEELLAAVLRRGVIDR